MRLRFYLQLMAERRPLVVAAVLAGAIAGATSGAAAPASLQVVFREVFAAETGTYTLWQIIGLAALLPAIFALRGLSMYISLYCLQIVGLHVLKRLRERLFAKLQKLPLAYFEQRQSGDLVTKLVADTLQIQNVIQLIARDGITQPFIAVAGLGYLVYLSIAQQNAAFLLLLLFFAPVMLWPVLYVGQRIKKRSRELQNVLGDSTSVLTENLRATMEVRSFNLEARERGRFGQAVERYNMLGLKIAKYYHMTQPLMEIVSVLIISAAFVYAYYQGVGFHTFLAMGGALFFTADATKKVLKLVTTVQRVRGSFERVEEVLNEPEAVQDAPDATAMPQASGAVDFRKVSFAYQTSEGSGPEKTIPALRDVELSVPAGQTVALVGPSGAGKSTFIKLLPRFYDVTAGSVTLDGQDVRKLSLTDLRQQIAIVPQRPVLFDATVAENIALGRPDATRAEIERAAQQAYAHDFISAMAQGYDTPVGEDATRLSGGQRQRIALARAILKDAPILILDEATSALDAESEQHIQRALRDYRNGRTVFLIAHRFSTIRDADRILLFESGRIIADGTFEALLEHPLFARLYASQQG